MGCYFDEDLDQVVHQFRPGGRTCECGKVEVGQPKRRYGNPFLGRKKKKPNGYEVQNLDDDPDSDSGDFGGMPED